MSLPQITELLLGFPGEQISPVFVDFRWIVEINVLCSLLRWRVRQFTGKDRINGEEGIAELGVLEEAILIFIEDLHEVVHVPYCNVFLIEYLRNTIVYLF